MAPHGLSRPPGAVQRKEPVPHDKWIADRFTGSMTLGLATVPGRFVSPGTGRLGVAEKESGAVAAQQVARAAGSPVIPGSGIKGAVRTVYELLSPSCDPFDRTCSSTACCDACSLFGLAGWGGRVSFSDAVPAHQGAVRIEVREVPMPWEPKGAKTGGEFRVYDLEEARMMDQERKVWTKRPKELAREVITGVLRTRMTFWNATDEELGRLLLSMGLGLEEDTRFELRLGGVKYDGQGGVRVTAEEIRLATPRRLVLQGEECAERTTRWMRNAYETSWGFTFWPVLQELAAALQATD